MKVTKNDMCLYVVTDRSWLGEDSLVHQVKEIMEAGATFLQLREKDITTEAFIALAKEIKEVTDEYNIPFVINDDIDVAVAVDADGVHIGQSDEELQTARRRLGKNKIIGLSVHNVEEAKQAEACGADYIGVGAVFPTVTKSDVELVTHQLLQEICDSVSIPVVAIGGIHENNIMELSGSHVDGIAVISAIFAQPDIKAATKKLLRLSRQMTE